MSEQTTEAPPEKGVVKHGGERTTGGALTRLTPKNFGELEHIAQILGKSDIVPKELIGKPANILLVLMFGDEIGLTAAQSLQNVMIVNGRPSLWGDATMGLCIASSVYEDSKDTFDEKTQTATFAAKRRGKDWVVRTFSMADAAKAKLDKKAGPWQEYPKRMLFHRARSWALRDTFPDVLKGIRYFEEERDVVDLQEGPGKTYEVPKEVKTEKAAAPQEAPVGVSQENRVSGAAVTDFNGQEAYVIRDASEPVVKYFTDQEAHFTLAKSAQQGNVVLTAQWEEREAGKTKFRWLLSLKAAE